MQWSFPMVAVLSIHITVAFINQILGNAKMTISIYYKQDYNDIVVYF